MTKLASLVALALIIGLGGCDSKPTHESVTKDMVSQIKEATATMKGVTDEASAKAASSKFKSLGEKMKKIKEQADALPKPTADQEKALKEKYGKELEAVMGEFAGEMMRIAMNPKLRDAMKDAEDAFKSIK